MDFFWVKFWLTAGNFKIVKINFDLVNKDHSATTIVQSDYSFLTVAVDVRNYAIDLL